MIYLQKYDLLFYMIKQYKLTCRHLVKGSQNNNEDRIENKHFYGYTIKF